MLVTTGIGHDHASVCMSDLLRVFDHRMKDIFFLGARSTRHYMQGSEGRNSEQERCFRVTHTLPGRTTHSTRSAGTAGFSPRRGGILNPDDCSSALGGGESDDALVTLGDICVSPFSTNWDCQRCVWS